MMMCQTKSIAYGWGGKTCYISIDWLQAEAMDYMNAIQFTQVDGHGVLACDVHDLYAGVRMQGDRV
jgi:hypothetical protein